MALAANSPIRWLIPCDLKPALGVSLQVRGQFSYLGADYNLRITDPVVEERFIPKGTGEYKIDDVLLTISLAEKLFTVASNPSSSGYYKLIAGVIDVSSLGKK